MRVLVAVAVMLLGAAAPAGAADAVGTASRVQGDVTGTVDGISSSVAAGGEIYLGETVATGGKARAALQFEDGTTLTLGENAEVVIDAFIYEPAGQSRLEATVAGAFRYVSGKLATGATRAASVATPFAVIGVRGTDFWGGPIDGRFGVVVLEGAITIDPPEGGSVDVDVPGMGVDIVAGAAEPPAMWSEERRQRAIATVSFE